MERMLNNFINGNLTDAKKQARRFGCGQIRTALIDQYGYSFRKATLTAEWLKGQGDWQAACDAE